MKNRLSVRLTLLLLLFVYILIPLSLHSSGSSIPNIDKNTVLLPSQSDYKISHFANAFINSKKMEDFVRTNGNWQYSIDNTTLTPRFAYGEPIKIPGFDNINDSNIEEACIKFLYNNRENFNIDVKNIRISRKNLVNGKWFVTSKQYYKGVEVLLSNIDIRISPSGKVFYFDIEYFNNIGIETNPAISPEDALEKSNYGMENKSLFNKTLAANKTYILPVKIGNKIMFRLVYKVNLESKNTFSKYVAYVDADKGDVVWRFSSVMKGQEFFTNGYVKKNSPTDTVSKENFSGLNVLVGNVTYTSDKNGKISYDNNGNNLVKSKLEGPWAKVYVEGINPAEFSGTIEQGKEFSLLFDDNNSHRYERNVFYYTNYIHEFMKNLDPAMTAVDKQINVLLSFIDNPNYGNEPNAFSKDDSIIFANCQIPYARMADDPGILYHEYGHSINSLLYKFLGKEDGMVNSTCQEALADITAASILDKSKVGLGVFTDDTLKYIRDINNYMIFPDSINGEEHHDSQILSGAFWDLRKKTNIDLFRKLSHFARYGLTDDPDVGIAFYKWFIETLIADDDDNNLANGTPNFNAIVESFNNHKIGTSLYFTNNFRHQPLDDTKNTTEPYIVEFSFGENSAPLVEPDSATVMYYTINGQELSEVKTVMAVRDLQTQKYTAKIPPQQKFSDLYYKIQIYVSGNPNPISFGQNLKGDPYNFSIGFKTAFLDNFENNLWWTAGSPEDDAKKGIWERGTPFLINLSDIGYGILKPGKNHTAGGNNYYSTGLSGVPENQKDNFDLIIRTLIPDGTTTLTSQLFDLSRIEEPYIKFFLFFRQINSYGDSSGYIPKFITQLSNDGGNNWVTAIEDTSGGVSDWVKVRFKFEDYLEKTDKCLVRFRYNGKKGWGDYPEVLGSVSIDDFEIQTAGDSTIADVTENNENNLFFIYPNPFDDFITIRFNSSNSNIVDFRVYSIDGEIVFGKNIFVKTGEKNSMIWDGKDNQRLELPSGIYIMRIICDGKVNFGKLIIQRY